MDNFILYQHHNLNGTVASIRILYPYVKTTTTFAKGRWIGKSLKDVMREFPSQNFKSITVNGKEVDDEYTFKHKDVLSSTVEIIEPPILFEDKPQFLSKAHSNVITLYKPCSIPSYPTGFYHIHSLQNLMINSFKDMNTDNDVLEQLKAFRIINRLDKLTSGLVLLAKSSAVANSFRNSLSSKLADFSNTDSIKDLKIQKFYLARVVGDISKSLKHLSSQSSSVSMISFHVPEFITDFKDQIPCFNVEGKWHIVHGFVSPARSEFIEKNKSASDEIKINRFAYKFTPEPVSQNKNIAEADSGLQHASTLFHVLSLLPPSLTVPIQSSLVLCQPLTGRTHQLRVTLQWLGHSIIGDVHYGCPHSIGIQLFNSIPFISHYQTETGGNNFSVGPSLKEENCENGNEEKVFLGGIALHAWRYEWKGLEGTEDGIETTNLPKWVFD